MFSRIRETYRRTAKAKDIFWNRYVARPLASVLVAALERTAVTPNQITIASLLVFLVAAGIMIVLPGHGGLAIAVAVIELSYVLDCVDGQLARMRGSSSPIGAHFDFLMDELKAFILVAATAGRLWDASGNPRTLMEGLLGLVAVASGISLTGFMRRPEYRAATGAVVSRGSGDYGDGPPPPPAEPARPPSLVRRVIGLVESLGKFLVHYPSYLVYVAIFDRLDIFLHVYAAVNAAYAARAMLGVTLRLGRGRA
jgi:hypothetical protein